ncbi:hypothetical protein T492DRAFT_1027996 [Pavlovales sp. CCMP2436]|nr:hypothetical protein T492DRAFT_1027996 [Pavlovales sp. CCMP2436]
MARGISIYLSICLYIYIYQYTYLSINSVVRSDEPRDQPLIRHYSYYSNYEKNKQSFGVTVLHDFDTFMLSISLSEYFIVLLFCYFRFILLFSESIPIREAASLETKLA